MTEMLLQAGLQALRSSKMFSPQLVDLLSDLASGDASDLKVSEHIPHDQVRIPVTADVTSLQAQKGSETITVYLLRTPALDGLQGVVQK